MSRKRSFLLGRTSRRRTTLYLVQDVCGPLRGPWRLHAVILN